MIIKWIYIVSLQLKEACTCLSFNDAKPLCLYKHIAIECSLHYFSFGLEIYKPRLLR